MRTPASMCVAQDPRAQGGLALGQLDQRVDALGRLGRRLVDRDGTRLPSAASSPITSVR